MKMLIAAACGIENHVGPSLFGLYVICSGLSGLTSFIFVSLSVFVCTKCIFHTAVAYIGIISLLFTLWVKIAKFLFFSSQ